MSKPTSTWIKTKLLTSSTLNLKGARQGDASKRVDLKIFEPKVILERERVTHGLEKEKEKERKSKEKVK